MRITTLSICVISLSILTGCGTTKVSNVRYRTEGASKTQIGYGGVRATLGTNMFDPKGPTYYEDDLQVQVTTEILSKNNKKYAHRVNVDVDQVGSVDVGANGSSSESARFVILEIMDIVTLVDWLNDPKNDKLRDKLSYYKNSRIITSVSLAYDYQKSKQFQIEGKVSTSIKQATGVDVELESNFESQSNIKYSDGTVFAYEYSRPIWKKGDDGKLLIHDLFPDRVGIDPPHVPDGMSLNPNKLK